MPSSRTIKHQCKYIYSEDDAKAWGKAHPKKPYPHTVGQQCRSSAVEFPKGSRKYEQYCASHIRAQNKCTLCNVQVTVGSRARRAKLRTRPCKNCALRGSERCKMHTPSAIKRVRRPATTIRAGAPTAEIRAAAASMTPPPRSASPIMMFKS